MDGLPYIGKNALSEHVYIATGFSGTGMTFGTLSAMILTDLITERPNPWARLYDATRVKLSSAPDFLAENKDYPVHLLLDRLFVQQADVMDIAPGEAKTVRKGIHGIAAYRDERGEFHFYSAVCPHMGCLVAWNKAEKRRIKI